MRVLKACVLFLRGMVSPRSTLAIGNLALREQFAVTPFRTRAAPRCLLRDRDVIDGDYFKDRIKSTDIEEVRCTEFTVAEPLR